MITKGMDGDIITRNMSWASELFFQRKVYRCFKDFNGKRGNRMAEYKLNENSTAVIGLWFKDENEKNVVPAEIVWRVDDAKLIGTSGGELVSDTTEVPSTFKHNLYIPASANLIINDENMWEEKIVTVRVTYGISGVVTEELRYSVKNLVRIPLPS